MNERSAMKLVILDRDGTINRDSDDFIKSPDEWIALPGSACAIEPRPVRRWMSSFKFVKL